MERETRVLIVGMMGAGKSTVGRQLASSLDLPYLDNDEMLHQIVGMSTAELLADAGEDTLRRTEAQVLHDLLRRPPPFVASVAAGAITDAEARRAMADRAFVAFLRAPIEILAERVAAGPERPWIGADPRVALERLAGDREDQYLEVADVVVDVGSSTPAQAAAHIVAALEVP